MIINNAVYDTLGDRWYSAKDDPIALLRAECRLRNPWVLDRIRERFQGSAEILDLGCGGGYLSNALAAAGHRVTGVDCSDGAIQVARRYDSTRSVNYRVADIRELAFREESFDVVCSMDVLEHVSPWQAVIRESARVLRPGGIFVFYTFNRTLLSWIFAVKGIEWFVRNTPKHLHSYDGFVRPNELKALARQQKLEVNSLIGLRPRFSKPFFQLLLTGSVSDDFAFRFTRSIQMGYLGTAIKS